MSAPTSGVRLRTDIVVIGAGQAGLSSAYHLTRRGLAPNRGFVVLDQSPNAGGAWQFRWPSLTLSTVNRIHDLPGMPFSVAVDTGATEAEAAIAVPRYFAAYEKEFGLPVYRPVKVTVVCDRGDRLHVETDRIEVSARGIINATGTWETPYIPEYPGADRFTGRQLHTRDYRAAAEFVGQHVVIVGGGISGLASALFLQRTARPRQCLVLDDHPIFGGLAKSNEIIVDGERLVGNQASALFFPPLPGSFLAEFYPSIGIDRDIFDYQTWNGSGPELPVGRTCYLSGGRGSSFYFGKAFGRPEGTLLVDPADLGDPPRRGDLRQPPRKQVVPRVAALHVDDLALQAELLDVAAGNDLHHDPCTYGRSAISRARLTAAATWRWWRRQAPVMRRLRILPFSET